VSSLRRSIDELELNLLESKSRVDDVNRLSKSNGSSLRSGASSLDHEKVLVDRSVSGESSHRGDRLGGEIELGRSVRLVSSLSNLVDLLVGLGSVMESVLSSSGNSERNSGRMPCSNTGDLSKSLVSLSRQSSGSPSRSNSSESVSLVGSESVNHLVLSEDSRNGNLLLEKSISEVDLLLDGSSVNLDLHEMSLLLSKSGLSNLGVGENSDDGSGSFQSSDLLGKNVLVVDVLLSVLGESFPLRSVPRSVESSSALVAQMGGPDGSQSSKSLGGGNVSNDSNDDHGWGLDNGDSLDDLLLVNLRSKLVDLSNDMGRSSLVSHESGKMDGLSLIILGELPHLSSVVFSSLSG